VGQTPQSDRFRWGTDRDSRIVQWCEDSRMLAAGKADRAGSDQDRCRRGRFGRARMAQAPSRYLGMGLFSPAEWG
jgi:hypothetical protein